mmetsp:Transcript_7248/g.16485  ORF Transcript_7248/g.16485 Transcript_7248/m.16485 type:complete len:122 (+) Transcript_7248:221-586(+)
MDDQEYTTFRSKYGLSAQKMEMCHLSTMLTTAMVHVISSSADSRNARWLTKASVHVVLSSRMSHSDHCSVLVFQYNNHFSVAASCRGPRGTHRVQYKSGFLGSLTPIGIDRFTSTQLRHGV